MSRGRNGFSAIKALAMLKSYTKDMDVTLSDLRRSVRVYLRLYPTLRPNLNYIDFCAVMDLDVLHSCGEKLFKHFSFEDDTSAPIDVNVGFEQKVKIRPILVSLCGLVKGSLEDKIRFLYSIYDLQNGGFIPEADMVEIMVASRFADDENQVITAIFTLFEGARQAPQRGISAYEMFEVLRDDRYLLFPHEPAGQKLVSSGH